MWTLQGKNPTIEIGNALKSKRRKSFLTLCTVDVTGGTIRPFHVNTVDGPTASRQPNVRIAFGYFIQLSDICRHVDVPIFHGVVSVDENKKNLRTSKVDIEHND